MIEGKADHGYSDVRLPAFKSRIYFLWHSDALSGAIRLGPLEPARESLVVRFLPVLFYASILLIVASHRDPTAPCRQATCSDFPGGSRSLSRSRRR